MFENQPKGLWALALANTGERFGYYTMLAVFLLYLQAKISQMTEDCQIKLQDTLQKIINDSNGGMICIII